MRDSGRRVERLLRASDVYSAPENKTKSVSFAFQGGAPSGREEQRRVRPGATPRVLRTCQVQNVRWSTSGSALPEKQWRPRSFVLGQGAVTECSTIVTPSDARGRAG